MSAIIKACLVANTVKNTGKECDISMGPTAMLIAVPQNLSFDDDDLLVPLTWLKTLMHAGAGVRVFPFFGQKAPIRMITNNQENDVTVTLDDGSTRFLRYGFYNRIFATTSGGLCYAQALASLNQSGYNIIEIDKQGQMLVHDNGDGTYTGLQTDFMYSPAPQLADLKSTVYMNRFQMSYDPDEMVQNGLILEGALPLLALMGLIDCEITRAAAPTTTKLKIGVQTECAETDLVALLGAPIAQVTNFIVTNTATGAVVTPSAAAIVGGLIELTGVFVSGQIYTVSGNLASVLYTNGVIGYDFVTSVDITIP